MAQTEQWLEYHVSPEPMGYRWIELSTNAPAAVPLPKLGTAAYYGYWTNRLDPSGRRWFCLDRSRKTGPCDRFFIDTNGDGRLEDERSVVTTRRDESMAYFEPVKLVFKGEDGPISYHLAVRFYQFGEQSAQLLVGAGGWYGGNVMLAGKKRRVQLIDNTVNGAFDDVSQDPEGSDRIVVDGEEGFSRYLGRYLEIEGQLVRLEVSMDGAFLKLRPATEVASGVVRVPESITEFTAVGTNGHFIRKPDRGEFKLPVGTYRPLAWDLVRKDEKATTWKLSGYRPGPGAAFAVEADRVAQVAIGEPIYAALEVVESKKDLQFSLRLLGSLGENVDIQRGGEQPRAPLLQVTGAGFSATRTFEYG